MPSKEREALARAVNALGRVVALTRPPEPEETDRDSEVEERDERGNRP